MKKVPTIILMALSVLFLVSCACGNDTIGPDSKITIGAILPLTGQLANFGNDVVSGIELLRIKYPDLNIIVEDDEGDPKKSLSVFRKLYSINNARYFYGPFGPTTAQTIHESQTLQEKSQAVFVAMSMCGKEFLAYENMLCNYPSPHYQLLESYKFPDSLGKKNFYIILPNDANGESIKAVIDDVAVELNLNILGASKVNVANTDFYTEVDKAMRTNPDVIVIATMSQQTNFAIIRELKERGYNDMIMSGGDFNNETINEFANVLDGVYLTGQAKMDFDTAFESSYIEKYGKAPSLYAAYGYMWFEILHGVIDGDNSKRVKIDEIANYVNSHASELAIKNVRYDNKRQVEFPMRVLLVENGKTEEAFVSEKIR